MPPAAAIATLQVGGEFHEGDGLAAHLAAGVFHQRLNGPGEQRQFDGRDGIMAVLYPLSGDLVGFRPFGKDILLKQPG